jgi:hypothetical protein
MVKKLLIPLDLAVYGKVEETRNLRVLLCIRL